MGSNLNLKLTSAFLVYFEKNWLQIYQADFNRYYYTQHVDDSFVLFTPAEHLEAFQNFLNGRHVNMSFTI